MAGTRTVHRGNKGRFAGSSGGKAETVKVGRGYSRGQTGGPKPVTGAAKASRNKARRRKIGAAAVNAGILAGGTAAALHPNASIQTRVVGASFAIGAAKGYESRRNTRIIAKANRKIGRAVQ